jgi:hypothetical protein
MAGALGSVFICDPQLTPVIAIACPCCIWQWFLRLEPDPRRIDPDQAVEVAPTQETLHWWLLADYTAIPSHPCLGARERMTWR